MRRKRFRVLILGAGYAGLRAALELSERVARGAPFRITLVDRNDYHTLVNLLHRVATDSLPPNAARLPLPFLLEHHPIQLLRGTVTRIQLEGSLVVVDGEPVPYDFLVVALGGVPAFFDIRGLEEHALTVRTWEAATAARERIAEGAASASAPVVVGGGGYTGAEVAGELTDWLPRLTGRRDRTVLLELSDRLLPGFPADLARRVERALRRKGADVRLRTGVSAVDDGVIELTTGDRIETVALVWTGGSRGPQVLRDAGFRVHRSGRVPVDRYLRPKGQTRVFVIGDAALIRDPIHGRAVSASAQLAVQEGATVARSIAAAATGDAPWAFLPRERGEVVAIGRGDAIADVGPLLVSGRAASALKEFALQRYLNSLGGVRVLQEFDRRRFQGIRRAG